jgi:anti-sigma factor RsiW
MADLRRHPDVVDLAEYAEGVLDASRQSAVEQHVRECDDCAATLAGLAGLPQTLAQAPVPPLPTDVADRLDRAIADEASARASKPADRPRPTVVPIRERRRWLAPVLVAAAVIGVIGIAVPALDNGTGGSSDDSSASTANEQGGAAGSSRASSQDKAVKPRGTPELSTVPNASGATVALSSDSFARDVANSFLPGQQERIVPGPADKPEASAESYAAQVSGLCPDPTAASLPSGELHEITLDGTPAHLLITQPGSATDAVAFSCQGSQAQVLASASLKPR